MKKLRIEDCDSECELSANSGDVGGIISWDNSTSDRSPGCTIDSCRFSGIINSSGTAQAGGIAGCVSYYTSNTSTSGESGDEHTVVPLFFGTTVRVYDADNGTITPNGIPMIIGGMTKTFKFVPDEGYAVADVIVNGTSYGAIEALTLDGFSGYITLTAVFEEVSAATDVDEP